jgi:hypothetical protein
VNDLLGTSNSLNISGWMILPNISIPVIVRKLGLLKNELASTAKTL